MTAAHPDSIMAPRDALPGRQYLVVFLSDTWDGRVVSGRYVGTRSPDGNWIVRAPRGGQSFHGVDDHEIAVVE
ncbi:hypothetical protein ACT17_14580 [Mycolicibacterium conceptionense]|uniref:Uncharacterized protein n=1 Tax=Mycolicibacterium conceptionense TaxID=451644 RepID=A0A0J8U7Y6_9MYCO|nr:hypothetical protein [Mycolicibacterium conceptionense]KMV17521.1 hypothetical protein ACT17_14580 [Mycolicibacterium conceptionense]